LRTDRTFGRARGIDVSVRSRRDAGTDRGSSPGFGIEASVAHGGVRRGIDVFAGRTPGRAARSQRRLQREFPRCTDRHEAQFQIAQSGRRGRLGAQLGLQQPARRGANFLFVDGKVRFLNDAINSETCCRLSDKADGNKVSDFCAPRWYRCERAARRRSLRRRTSAFRPGRCPLPPDES